MRFGSECEHATSGGHLNTEEDSGGVRVSSPLTADLTIMASERGRDTVMMLALEPYPATRFGAVVRWGLDFPPLLL